MLELDRAESLRMLAAGDVGRLIVAFGHGDPVIRPVNYVFDKTSQSVVFRTGMGSKLHALLGASRAWFEVDGLDSSTRTGWSVIVVGPVEQIVDPDELGRLRAARPQPWAPGAKSNWFRLRAVSATGRRIVRTADHVPGYRAP
jgi:uncharacterized protein